MPATLRRIFLRFAASLGLALPAFGPLAPTPGPAVAQGAPSLRIQRDAQLSQLESKYGGVPLAIGVADGALVELLTAKDGITWTTSSWPRPRVSLA